jgi:DNA-binding transcriptional regulator YbjK
VTSRAASSKPARRTFEPGRRDRIIDVALTVIAERGIAGTSHRAVAEAAGVPLGATTYYFHSLEELHEEAFKRHAAAFLDTYRARLASVAGREQVLDVLVDLVLDQLADRGALVVTVELYALAVRKPAFYAIADGWVQTTRDLLESYTDPESARAVNALIEGIVLHGALSQTTFTREQLHHELNLLVARS